MEICSTKKALEMSLHGIESTSVRFQEWKGQKMNDGKDKMRVIDTELRKEDIVDVSGICKSYYQVS